MSTQTARTRPLLPRVQALSGLAFSLFLTLHLVNTSVAAFGREAYDGTQAALRTAYQAPPVELALVFVPLVVHIAAAVTSMVRRGRKALRLPTSPSIRAHRIAGYVLLLFIVGHVLATRGLGWLFGAPPGFDGVAFAIVWVPAYFVPYYAALGLAGVVHGVVGITMSLKILGLAPSERLVGSLRKGAWVLGALIVAAVASFAGAFGEVRTRAVASDYARTVQAVADEPSIAADAARLRLETGRPVSLEAAREAPPDR